MSDPVLRRHPRVMAELALECHRRHCDVCRRARRTGEPPCATVQELIQAVQRALSPASRG